MYQNEYLYLEITSTIEEDVEDLIICLHGYLSFLEKIYVKIFLYIEPKTQSKYHEVFSMIKSSKIHSVFKYYSPEENEEEEPSLDRKRIELKKNITPIQLYEEVCKVPFSIRLYEKELKNRDMKKEDEYYQLHLQHYQNSSYIFCTSIYLEENEKSLPIYIVSKPYFHDNIYDTYWYLLNERSMYQTMKIIENAEEVHLSSKEKRWIEWIYFMDMKRVKRMVIYYQNEEEVEDLKKNYPWIHLFDFIELKENEIE